jgi:hypothetical protein
MDSPALAPGASVRQVQVSIILRASLLAVILILLFASACSPAPTATPFIPPTEPAPLIEPTFIIQPTQPVVIVQPSPIPTIPTLEPTLSAEECTNNLTFVTDITVPDNSTFVFGEIIDKQWLVENSGTCNWDSNYRLRHTNGASLGASEELALYPARAGTQATIQIIFTAPFSEDFFQSGWQAIAPDGTPFGDPIYIQINVQPGG